MSVKIAKFITLKLLRLATLLAAAAAVAFILISVSPINPIDSYIGSGVSISYEQKAEIEKYWGLDEKPLEQFLKWGGSLLSLDLGVSKIYRAPVVEVIMQKAMNSFALMGAAWIFAGIIGFSLGIIMGVFRESFIDDILKSISLILSSTPTFWVGMLLLIIFAVWLPIFPTGLSSPAGVISADVSIGDKIYHLILPALALSLTSFSNIALQTRQKLIAVLESEYALFAKARGETKRQIVFRHSIRNTIIPAITLQFASFSELFGGALLAEQIFSYPGLGQTVVQAGLRSDIPLLLGITIFSALFVFIGNFIADIINASVDPRIRRQA